MACNLTSPISFGFSQWLAAWNYIPYRFESGKWPINNFDPVEAVASITTYQGYARVTITSPTITYLKKSSVKLSDMSNAEYNGVWQVRQVISASVLVLSAPYVGNATGDIQKYYNNYSIVCNLYAGFPSLDPYYTELGKGVRLIGTDYVKPNAEGVAVFDASGFVQAWYEKIQDRFCEHLAALGVGGFATTDPDLYCPFYISFSEAYDITDGTNVIGLVTTAQNDIDANGDIQYYYASYSAKQFGQSNGRSMGDYVAAVQDPQTLAKWLTMFEKPVYFVGYPFDLAIGVDISEADFVLEEYINGSISAGDVETPLTENTNGIWRFSLEDYDFVTACDRADIKITETGGGAQTSELISVDISRGCNRPGAFYLRWLNPLGGWDNWLFQGLHDYSTAVGEKLTLRRDIYESERIFAGGVTQDDVYRVAAVERRVVRSQFLTEQQMEAIRYIYTSPKVFHIYEDSETICGRFRQRTVIIDPGSFTYRQGNDRLYTVDVAFRYSDETIIQGQ